MNTIIYLKIKKTQRQSKQENPMFHLTRISQDTADLGEEALLFRDGMQILYVTIPWELEMKRSGWPLELSQWLLPFFGYSASIETLYGPTVENWLKQKGIMEEWSAYWPFPVYKEYHLPEYAKILMKKGMECLGTGQVYCYVLGYEPFLPRILSPYMKNIKALEFIVAKDHPILPHGYLEDLAWEEGIAGNCIVLSDKTQYRRLRPHCRGPAIVLDFTGEEKVLPADADQTMVWIDMDALDTKKHRILANSSKTMYFSMKEEWSRLDTVGKNRYNTLVN